MRVTSSGKYQNKKMASFFEEENSACRALRVHYSLLAEGIQDPERLACDLYSSSVVSQEVLAAVSMMPQTPLQQKMKLLDGVRCAVAVDEATFPLFVEALKDRPELARLAEMLEALCECKWGGVNSYKPRPHVLIATKILRAVCAIGD